MSEKEICDFLPLTPPDGLIPWLKEKGRFEYNYIIYKASREKEIISGEENSVKVVECKCTACGTTFNAPYSGGNGCSRYAPAPFGFFNYQTNDHVISGDSTLCPHCASQVKALHVGSFRFEYNERESWPLTVHRIDNKVCLILWCVFRTVDKQACVKVVTKPYEAYVFENKTCNKYCGYYKYFKSFSWLNCWEMRKRSTDEIGRVEMIFPFSDDLFEGTEFENCKLGKYVNDAKDAFPITYLKTFQKHKNIENLVVQGCSSLLSEMIKSACQNPSGYWGRSYVGKTNFANINWKDKRPAQMLHLTKDEFCRMVKNKWTYDEYRFFITCKELGEIPTDEDLSCFKVVGLHGAFILSECEIPRDGRGSFLKSIRYIVKQKHKFPQDDVYVNVLTDYWRMSRQLGDTLESESEIYPQRIKTAHDNLTKRINAQKTELRVKQFEERYKELCKYEFSNEAFVITPPRDEKDLIKEGKALSHCVASYAERHATGATAILFIRKLDKPKTPYFTLELDENNLTVRQNRGKRNCDRTPEIIAFEAEFLKHIQKLRRKTK